MRSRFTARPPSAGRYYPTLLTLDAIFSMVYRGGQPRSSSTLGTTESHRNTTKLASAPWESPCPLLHQQLGTTARRVGDGRGQQPTRQFDFRKDQVTSQYDQGYSQGLSHLGDRVPRLDPPLSRLSSSPLLLRGPIPPQLRLQRTQPCPHHDSLCHSVSLVARDRRATGQSSDVNLRSSTTRMGTRPLAFALPSANARGIVRRALDRKMTWSAVSTADRVSRASPISESLSPSRDDPAGGDDGCTADTAD